MKESPYLRLLLYAPNDDIPIKVELAIIRWASDDEFGLEFIRMHAGQQHRLRRLIRLLEMMPGQDSWAPASRSTRPRT